MKSVNKEIQKAFHEERKTKTKFVDSISELKVNLIGYTCPNVYKIILEVATHTFGDYDVATRWEMLSPEARFTLVKGVLEKRALPLAVEHIKFNFLITGLSRCAFDELVRARVGVSYGTKGWKGNFLNNVGFNIPSPILKYPKLRKELEKHVRAGNKLYKLLQDSDIPNWACRYVCPMGYTYRFIMSLDFIALQQLCSHRMNQTEQEDVVGVAYLMREEVKKKFPLLAHYLRAGEDWVKRDLTLNANGYAYEREEVEHFPGERWPVNLEEFKKKYKILHEEPCTHTKVLEKYLKIKLPKREWEDLTWEKLSLKDKKLFNEK